MREKFPLKVKFLVNQILNYKLSSKLSAIYHDQKDIIDSDIEQATTKKIFVEPWNFDLMEHFGQFWLVLWIAILASHRK